MLCYSLGGKSKGFKILKFSQETSQNPFFSAKKNKALLGKGPCHSITNILADFHIHTLALSCFLDNALNWFKPISKSTSPPHGASDPFPPTLEGSPDRFRAPLSGPASLVPPKPSLPTVTSGSWFAFALTLQISDGRGHRICRHLHTPPPNPYTHRLSPFIRDSQMLVHTQNLRIYRLQGSTPGVLIQ